MPAARRAGAARLGRMGADAELRRRIPSVDALLRSDPGKRVSASLGRPLVKRTLTEVLGEVRAQAERGVAPPDDGELLARAAQLASRAVTGLVPVINATGVVLHTGLGRAPLPGFAADAARQAAGYGDVEIDRATGRRARRSMRAEVLITAITGAEAALVVNNCAAALLLSVAAIARHRDVLVSRGELIEIGGDFRIPDILAASEANLREVGTTNRTTVDDYRRALSERTAMLMKVHPSNYRVVGFTTSPSAAQLAELARAANTPFLYDLGSGLLRRYPGLPADEPAADEALSDGADLVTFSGDKLIGGPQAGIVIGRDELVERLRRHAIARAVRVDKMAIAALERVLAAYVRGEQTQLPVWRMLLEPVDEVKRRADALAGLLRTAHTGVRVVQTESTVGGGSMPGHAVPSWAVSLAVPDPDAMAARLRAGAVSVACRVDERDVTFDLRTVAPEQVRHLSHAIVRATEGDDVSAGG
jgi:L-seryl-tRNA(Ser) seleniumtransferase